MIDYYSPKVVIGGKQMRLKWHGDGMPKNAWREAADFLNKSLFGMMSDNLVREESLIGCRLIASTNPHGYFVELIVSKDASNDNQSHTVTISQEHFSFVDDGGAPALDGTAAVAAHP